MRNLRFLSVALLLVTACGSICLAADGSKPNIVLIISDDQAWTDFGFMGHEAIQTPHLDHLAEESVVFRRGYVPTALCRPSLMTLATGQFAHRHGVTGNDPSPKYADPKSPLYAERRAKLISYIDRFDTLPELLVEQGYLCHQSGKWWEGSYSHGGFTHGMTRGFPEPGGRHGDDGLKIGREGMEPVTEFVDMAVEEKKPFFLWYAPFLPHSPHNPPERLLQKYEKEGRPPSIASYYTMCEWFDETCGELLGHLVKKGVRDNTLVVYVTDNGWIQNPAGRGYAPRSKQTPYEGGVRTPIMFSWPAALKPADRPELVSSIDLVPTILAAAGARTPKDLPGLNLLPNLRTGAKIERDAIFGEGFAHDIADIEKPEASLLYRWCIQGKWKLILTYDGEVNRYKSTHPRTEKGPQLFDLLADPREEKNLTADHPEVVARLAKRIADWYPVTERKTQVSAAPTANRPNIIMLLADDQRWDTLGCMGNKIIETPNVDRLASQGIVFDNVFVTTSICMTNRACIFTGQYASRHGVVDFRTNFTPEQLAETYPGQLKQAGYYTGFIGKWGVGSPPKDYFDYNKGWPGQNRYFPDKTDLSVHLTTQMGDQAIEFLDGTPGDRPFLLAFSFKAPHVQDGDPNDETKEFTPAIRALYDKFPGGFLHDPKLEPLYRDAVFPDPPLSDPGFFASLPKYFEPTETRKRWEWRFSTPEMYQRTMKAYYSLITGVDNVVGRIVKKLEEKGVSDNTVILYHGDNGFYLGERGFAGKWYAHEVSLRVPLVIYDPRLPQSQKGTRRDQFALSIDLAPTMLDMAGVVRPERMQGESLVPILRGETPEWRDEFFYEHLFDIGERIPMSQAVRGTQYKYIRYLVDDPRNEELYDFKNDPDEAKNLVDDPKYAELLKEMRAKLEAWKERAK